MKKIKEEPKQTMGVRLVKEDRMAIIDLALKLDLDDSEAHRYIIHKGLNAIHSRKVSNSNRFLEAYCMLANNEAILLGLFILFKGKEFKGETLLSLGFKFGCQSSETFFAADQLLDPNMAISGELITKWMIHHGLTELKEDVFIIHKRD